jgi:hypothetical protein
MAALTKYTLNTGEPCEQLLLATARWNVVKFNAGTAMMITIQRLAVVFLTAALMTAHSVGDLRADYKIPDDCLGDWDYCNSLWVRNLDRFGRHAFDTLPFEEDTGFLGAPAPSLTRKSKSRLGCEEGRDVVIARGFARVRSVDCRGRTFTYHGHRNGSMFKIRLSSRTGRILDIGPI